MLLSRRQAQVLRFIERFLKKHRYAPSYGEIAAAFGLSSLGTVHQHVQALERKGYVEKGWNQHRALSLTGTSAATVRLPFRDGGRARTIALPRSLVGPGPHVAELVREGGGPHEARPGDILISRTMTRQDERRDGTMSGAAFTGDAGGASLARDGSAGPHVTPVALIRLLASPPVRKRQPRGRRVDW